MKNLYPLSPKIMRIECDNIKICQSKSVTVSVSVFIMKVYTNTDKICKQIKDMFVYFVKHCLTNSLLSSGRHVPKQCSSTKLSYFLLK